jgi:membrane protease subunit (stomatin/prohibitin family)
VRLRARGNCSYKVGISEEMLTRFVGARPEFTIEHMEGQLRTRIVSSLSDALGELKIPALDLVAQYDEISASMQEKLDSVFTALGLNLLSFTIENISLPAEVEKAMDQRSSMGAVGNLNQYSQFQAANALRDAAQNEGGSAGGMMGMMVGGQLGNSVGGVLHQETPPAPGPVCPKCGVATPVGAKFCGGCGEKLGSSEGKCVKCGAALAAGAKFCGDCGAAQKAQCVKCNAELAPGSKFCGACGAAQA